MSNYLGFEPSNNPNYYFISYNSEDADRVSEIAKRLFHGNVPLWYDHGIEYGEDWEKKISSKLMNAQAVILFFTKDILFKEHSYVYKEYLMATEYFDKKVYVVMMDKINNKEVPPARVPWWIDVQSLQSINVVGVSDLDFISKEILKAIGLETYEDIMNQIIKEYRELYDGGDHEAAERFFDEYLKGKSLAGKAQCIANACSGKIDGMTIESHIAEYTNLETPLKNHVGEYVNSFFEGIQLTVGGSVFTFGNSFIFHRGQYGDAHVINVWCNDSNITTVGGLIEARDMRAYYDSLDDIIYVVYKSEVETRNGADFDSQTYISVLTIEDPTNTAICNNFKNLVAIEY